MDIENLLAKQSDTPFMLIINSDVDLNTFRSIVHKLNYKIDVKLEKLGTYTIKDKSVTWYNKSIDHIRSRDIPIFAIKLNGDIEHIQIHKNYCGICGRLLNNNSNICDICNIKFNFD